MKSDQYTSMLDTLQKWADNPHLIDDQDQIKSLITKIYKSARKSRRFDKHIKRKTHDQLACETTSRCSAERLISDTAGDRVEALEINNPTPLQGTLKCYICKQPYSSLDSHYHMLCPTCAQENRDKRIQRTDLSGRKALLTGGRIKIGFYLALKMLRDGAEVWATTRFPVDAVKRFSAQDDYDHWAHRLHIIELNLLNLPFVEQLAHKLTSQEIYFDIIINNAAQTIKRPEAYYHQLTQNEKQHQLNDHQQKLISTLDSPPLQTSTDIMGDISRYFPEGLYSADGQPLDLREQNSWTLKQEDVTMQELLEVHIINSFSPYVLINVLKAGMLKSSNRPRFIVNVSAMEGSFSRHNKTANHPHTNMAKAAMNMITRTSASDFVKDDIYMNSVDTGWITEENPFPRKKAKREKGFVPPLDEIDGAARIYAPIVEGLNHKAEYGKFLKDYKEYPW